jgi:hypothetical protein
MFVHFLSTIFLVIIIVCHTSDNIDSIRGIVVLKSTKQLSA